MKITAGGHTYELDLASLSNRDIAALEAGLGLTFAQWMSGLAKSTENGASINDATALVFLARRQNGEKTLKFDDVDFPFSTLTIEDDSAPTDAAAVGPMPDPAADPTDGSLTTVSEPYTEPSPLNV